MIANNDQLRSDIIRAREGGATYRVIALQVGCSPSTCRRIIAHHRPDLRRRARSEHIIASTGPAPKLRMMTVLRTIDAHLTWFGVPPSLREIARCMNSGTTAVISCLSRLEKAGCVTRVRGASRALAITPAGYALLAAERRYDGVPLGGSNGRT